MAAKKIALSGIRTTGELHLGNYLGALLHFEAMKGDYQGFYFLADLHALTTEHDPEIIRQATLETATFYLAVGLDKHATIFRQSEVSAHSELTWLLNTVATTGELSRMIQFKEKSAGTPQGSVSVGLFDYPVLMAADILLYQADMVPVGHDQKQHVELTRDLAQRFNHRFKSPVFKIPDIHVSADGGKIMALDDPTKKMSKSGNRNSYIALKDDADTIRRKIRKAVTDSGSTVNVRKAGPAITNLINIYKLCQAQTPTEAQVAQTFDGKQYGEFKDLVADQVIEWLSGIQATFAEYEKNPDKVTQRLDAGAVIARNVANQTLLAAQTAMGLR